MTIDPRVGFWFSIVMAIVSALGVCGTQLTTLFGDAMANKILAGIVVLNAVNGAINAILHAIPSKPGSANEFPLGPKVAQVILLGLVLGALAFPGTAMAQTKLKLPIDPLGLNDKPPLNIIPGGKLTGSAVTDIQSFMNAKFLPDLQYALKLAQASKNNITSDCYQAWIDIITTQQTAVQTKNPDGTTTDLPMPDPHVITEFEKLVELRSALQPESPFMVKCSPVASMIKKDIASFMGIVISGGAGLATLVPGL